MLGQLSELNRFPYTGHAVIVEHRDYRCQDVDVVLKWFGNCKGPVKLAEDIGVLLTQGSTGEDGRTFVVVASFEAPGVESNWCDGEKVSGNWGKSGFCNVGRLSGDPER